MIHAFRLIGAFALALALLACLPGVALAAPDGLDTFAFAAGTGKVITAVGPGQDNEKIKSSGSNYFQARIIFSESHRCD